MTRFLWLGVVLSTAAQLPAQTNPKPAARPKPASTKRAASSADEVKSLREAVAAQQQQIEQQRQETDQLKAQLQQLLEANRQASAAAEKEHNSVEQAQHTAAAAQKSAAEAQRLAGDVRLRFEPLLQDLMPNRYRARLRVRFGVEGKVGEDFTGGFYLATGSVGDDPVSTNQTFTGFFSRKTIGIDRGWITYQPSRFKPLQLTGGKFQTTWQRTSLTLDPDLNPEGFSEKLSFDIKNPVVKNVSFTGMQLIFNEIAGTNIPLVLGNDSAAFGGQASVKLQLGRRVTTTLSGTGINWRNADSIIQAITAKTLGGNRNTNATVGSGSTIAYASQFLYADFIADTSFKTGSERWPLRLTLDFITNPRATSSQGQGFWGETAIGRLQAKNDVQFGYAFGRIEQDAVIAAFNESELRAPTNILQHKLQVQWLAQKNTTISFTSWIGRTLSRDLQNAALPPGLPPGENDPYVKRLQADFIYKF